MNNKNDEMLDPRNNVNDEVFDPMNNQHDAAFDRAVTRPPQAAAQSNQARLGGPGLDRDALDLGRHIGYTYTESGSFFSNGFEPCLQDAPAVQNHGAEGGEVGAPVAVLNAADEVSIQGAQVLKAADEPSIQRAQVEKDEVQIVANEASIQLVQKVEVSSTMADSKQAPSKPIFTKVIQLRPMSSGVTLTVKVVSTKVIVPKGHAGGPRSQMQVVECLVGDETGMIIFRARNKQAELMKEGSTVTLQNAKIDMFKGSMRLAVDKSGHVEVAEPASFAVMKNNNLSLIEFKRVDFAM